MKSWWRSCEITSKKLPVLYIGTFISLHIVYYHHQLFPFLQLFTAKDQIVVEGFSELLHQTEEREVRINKITKRLNEELMYLSKFLENLATRRPQRKSPPPPPNKGIIHAITEDGFLPQPLITDFNFYILMIHLYLGLVDLSFFEIQSSLIHIYICNTCTFFSI